MRVHLAREELPSGSNNKEAEERRRDRRSEGGGSGTGSDDDDDGSGARSRRREEVGAPHAMNDRWLAHLLSRPPYPQSDAV